MGLRGNISLKMDNFQFPFYQRSCQSPCQTLSVKHWTSVCWTTSDAIFWSSPDHIPGPKKLLGWVRARGKPAVFGPKAKLSVPPSVISTLFSSAHKPQFPQGLMKPGGIPRRMCSLQTGQAGNKTRLLTGRGMFLEIPFYYLFLTEHAKNHTL